MSSTGSAIERREGSACWHDAVRHDVGASATSSAL
jgi:hypothetical protein